MRDRFSADPTIVFMTSVLDEVARGRLQIPRFQRPLVWDWSQRRDLLSSILEGLPIGALMIWLSSEEYVERYKKLGPYDLPEPPAGNNRYLMDGVQRVSTLFGALHAYQNWSEIDSDTDDTVADFSVLVDLDAKEDTDRFVRASEIPLEQINVDPSRYMPLRHVLDNHGLLRFQRGVADGFEYRIDVSDEIALAFRQYKIPLITLENASLEIVTKSFQRVNSRGVVMSEMHMINALTYSSKFDLLGLDKEMRRNMLSEVGWGDLDQDIILRSLKLRLDVELYKANPEEASRKLKRQPQAVTDVFKGLRLAADLFSSRIGISSPELIPYRLQLICIAAKLGVGLSHVKESSLIDWFWMTTYTEAFGLSARQSEIAISDLRSFLKHGSFKWGLKQRPLVRSPIGKKADFRAARGKALALALARRLDIFEFRMGSDILSRYKRDAFSTFGSNTITRGRIGSRFLIAPQDASALRNALFSGKISEEQMFQHIVSPCAIDDMKNYGFEAFITRREHDIYLFEKGEIFGPAFVNLELPFQEAEPLDAHVLDAEDLS